MLSFESIFKNHFDTKEISDDNLKKFTEKHIQQLTANNGGGTFTVTITDTTNAYTSYFGRMSNEDVAFAVQQGLTITTDAIFKDFQNTVSQKEGIIKGTYGKNSPAYQEFFPLGLTEYSNATKANIETLMTRMVTASTAHVADLGAPFVAIFTALKTNYLAARSAQLLKIGEVDATKTGTETSRNALEVQLLKNLFFVGFNFPGDITRCLDFFDQNIIRYDSDSATDGFGKATGLIRHNGTPIFDAAFELIGTNIPIARSNADGRYKTRKTPIGHYQARITSAGLPEQIVELDIVDDGDTNLDLDI
ncbi:MAG: hypothetical protein ACHQNT_04245 [Bacteroidia bacterium]